MEKGYLINVTHFSIMSGKDIRTVYNCKNSDIFHTIGEMFFRSMEEIYAISYAEYSEKLENEFTVKGNRIRPWQNKYFPSKEEKHYLIYGTTTEKEKAPVTEVFEYTGKDVFHAMGEIQMERLKSGRSVRFCYSDYLPSKVKFWHDEGFTNIPVWKDWYDSAGNEINHDERER